MINAFFADFKADWEKILDEAEEMLDDEEDFANDEEFIVNYTEHWTPVSMEELFGKERPRFNSVDGNMDNTGNTRSRRRRNIRAPTSATGTVNDVSANHVNVQSVNSIASVNSGLDLPVVDPGNMIDLAAALGLHPGQL